MLLHYLSGSEYEDVAAAWDWNLLPGTTTAYGAIPLTCDKASWNGTESFVGGVSTGTMGVAAMRWTNPIEPDLLAYHKSWFFVDDGVHHVLIPGVESNSTTSPIYTALDQKRHSGRTGVYVDGNLVQTSPANFSNATTLWTDGIGYRFDSAATGRGLQELYVKVENRTGQWSSIGTSNAGSSAVTMFSAWIQHDSSLGDPLSYTVYPGLDSVEDTLAKPAVTVIRNDVGVSAVYGPGNLTVLAVFWGAGLNFTVPPANATFVTSEPVVMIVDLVGRNGTVADPTQMLDRVNVTMIGQGGTQTVSVTLPKGGDGVQFSFDDSETTGGGARRSRRSQSRRYRVRRPH